jgi:hypothetical protein
MGIAGDVLKEIEARVGRNSPPPPEELATDIESVCEVLETESEEWRPRDDDGRTGGIVYLQKEVPTVVLPDIHGRIGLIVTALERSFPEIGIEIPLVKAIDDGEAHLVMVGDYVHGEARVRTRWLAAFEEFQGGYRRHDAIDAEMFESLTVLQLFALLKRAYPEHVHGLKGNHENIANEEGRGNHPFGKFAYEGAMVAEYMETFYPGRPFDAVYRLEHDLPLLVVGEAFLVSHAEPLDPYTREDILNYRARPEVVEGLTWTDNDAASAGSVAEMLDHFLPAVEEERRVYLGGHRPVSGLYALRGDGDYVQFHNPGRQIAAVLPLYTSFDPDRHVIEL